VIAYQIDSPVQVHVLAGYAVVVLLQLNQPVHRGAFQVVPVGSSVSIIKEELTMRHVSILLVNLEFGAKDVAHHNKRQALAANCAAEIRRE
jgi:hypothetical protein